MPRWVIPLSSTAATSCSSPPAAPQRQLTRCRRLRHLQDHEVADFDFDLLEARAASDARVQVKTAAADGGSYDAKRSSVDIDSSDNMARFSTAVPQPLPLPDLTTLFICNDRKLEGGYLPRLPSPEEGAKEKPRGREREIGKEKSSEGSGRDRFSAASPCHSGTSHQDARSGGSARRSVDLVEIWLSGNMLQCMKGVVKAQENVHILESTFRPRNSSSHPASRVSPKLFVDTSAVHLDSNFPQSRHPLPLPPRAATPSLSSPVPQILAQSSPLSQMSALSTPHPQSSSQASPHPQNSAQTSPHSQISAKSFPASQISSKPECSVHKSQWNKGKLIGRGTFGSVYVATNRETGALCAMKEVELCHDDPKCVECMKQLEQEIKVLSNLKHPNIVQYYGSQIVDDRFYIYLEYVYPGSINKYVHDHCGAMTESVVRNFTRHILSGLAYLHSKKTIHRDIKGANLLVDASGVVKLADFGMAKHLTGQAADLSMKGSPYWMAPELMQAVIKKDNSSDLAFAVDIWSLGCTVIEMFTGKPPWNECEGAAAMFKVLKESPPIPDTLSADGKDFLRCCFQRNPAERPSASMLLEHRFLRNSQQPDVPYYLPTSNRMQPMDKAFSARGLPVPKSDQTATSPTRRTSKGKIVTAPT